jgi:hypothetical protein
MTFISSSYITKLLASDRASGDSYGASVDISLDGNTAVIGAPLENSDFIDNGAVYVYVRSGSTWTEQQKLLASESSNDIQFGKSVSISADGNTVVIGAPLSDLGGATSSIGAAYVFTRSAGVWTQQQTLSAFDPATGDRFGWSVSLSADGLSLIVGAYLEDTSPNTNNGAAYVFIYESGAWTEQQKLLASDPATDDFFGWGVALSSDGNTALISAIEEDTSPNSANGAVYVFTRTAGVWTQQQKLTASDPATLDSFGYSVSLSSDGLTAIIGAPSEDTSPNTNNGAAYVFTRSGSTWTQQQKILASDAASNETLGVSVSISADGNVALIGADAEDTSPNTDNGAAYVFTRSAGVWTEQQKL